MRTIVVITGLSLAVAACGGDGGSERLGILITEDPAMAAAGPGSNVLALAWLGEDAVVYAGRTAGGPLGVRVVGLDGSIRGELPPDEFVLALEVSDDASLVVYSTECTRAGRGRSLRAWDGVAADGVLIADCGLDDRVALALEVGRPAFVVGPGGLWVAYARIAEPDAPVVVVHDMETGDERELGLGWPVAVSPDGSELLLYNGRWMSSSPAPLWAVSVADGTERSLAPPAADVQPRELRWTDDGPMLLAISPDPDGWVATVQSLDTGESRTVWRGSRTAEGRVAWSTDGERIAFWTVRCVSGGWTTCQKVERRLVAIHVPTGAQTLVARTPRTALHVALAGDRSALAYDVEARIYRDELPW